MYRQKASILNFPDLVGPCCTSRKGGFAERVLTVSSGTCRSLLRPATARRTGQTTMRRCASAARFRPGSIPRWSGTEIVAEIMFVDAPSPNGLLIKSASADRCIQFMSEYHSAPLNGGRWTGSLQKGSQTRSNFGIPAPLGQILPQISDHCTANRHLSVSSDRRTYHYLKVDSCWLTCPCRTWLKPECRVSPSTFKRLEASLMTFLE